MEPAVKVRVKVIDSEGKPIEGVSIGKFYEDHRTIVGHTNPEGIKEVYVYAHSKGKFTTQLSGKGHKVSIPFYVGGQEDDGREFKLVLPD